MWSMVLPVAFLGAFHAAPMFLVPLPGASFSGPKGLETPTTGRIDVNKATIEELVHLPGIGPEKARRIIRERESRPFRKASDLLRVKGIGRKTLRRMIPLLDFKKR